MQSPRVPLGWQTAGSDPGLPGWGSPAGPGALEVGKEGARWDLSGHLPALADLAQLPDDTLAGNLLGQGLLSGVHSLPAHDDNLD